MCQREYAQGFLHSSYSQNYEWPNLLDLLTFLNGYILEWFIDFLGYIYTIQLSLKGDRRGRYTDTKIISD